MSSSSAWCSLAATTAATCRRLRLCPLPAPIHHHRSRTSTTGQDQPRRPSASPRAAIGSAIRKISRRHSRAYGWLAERDQSWRLAQLLRCRGKVLPLQNLCRATLYPRGQGRTQPASSSCSRQCRLPLDDDALEPERTLHAMVQKLLRDITCEARSPTYPHDLHRCRGAPILGPPETAMAINGHRNKPIGPGGSTRRLHHLLPAAGGANGGEIGSTRA